MSSYTVVLKLIACVELFHIAKFTKLENYAYHKIILNYNYNSETHIFYET